MAPDELHQARRRRSRSSPPCRARRRGRGRRGCARSRPGAARAARRTGRRRARPAISAAARPAQPGGQGSRDFQETGRIRVDVHVRAPCVAKASRGAKACALPARRADDDAVPHLQQNRLLGIGLRIGAATCFGFMAAMIKLGARGRASACPSSLSTASPSACRRCSLWIALTGNFGAWRTQRPLAHLGARRDRACRRWCSAFSRAHLPAAGRSGDDRLRRAAVLGDAVGADPRRAGRPPSLERGRARLRRRADRDAAERQRICRRSGSRSRSLAALRRRRRDDHHPPDRPDREHADDRALVHPASRCWRPACSCPSSARRTTRATWAILVALGLFGGIGQLFLTSSLRFAPVPVVVPFDYTQLLWAVLLGWLIWDTHPPATTWVGAAVIVASGLYTALSRAQARAGEAARRSRC